MESKTFGEVELGAFFLDMNMAICMKTQDVECLVPDGDIVWDDGFNAIEFDKGRYYKQRFKMDDSVTIIDIHNDLELLMNKIGGY